MEKMSLNEPLNDLNALNKHLLEKIAQLEAENADLRRRLGLDRTNSHKPPSSDGYLMKPGFASKENCAGCTPRPSYTPLFIHENRGAKALESDASVLKNFKGTAVHDGWAPYFQFNQAQHALCGAHWLRELNSLLENGREWAVRMRAFLLDWHEKPRPVANPEDTRNRSQTILAPADWEAPQRGKPKNSVGRNLLNRLAEHREGVLALAFKAGVGFTHNPALRDLRLAKVKQKVSGGFRTPSGAQVYARLQATVSTFRKPGLNVFASLRD